MSLEAMPKPRHQLEKMPTGIAGFDLITEGGLPVGRSTLVSGTAGSAKTVFACQFLASGILYHQHPGVFVTFEEQPNDIRRNMLSFGWEIESWEKEGLWAFVDGSPQAGEDMVEVGQYDLGGLLSRLEYAIRRLKAKRVAIDSLAGIFSQLSDARLVRQEVLRVTTMLKKLGVTSLVTSERSEEASSLSRFGVEEFVTDNVVVLRNVLEQEKRRRTVEVLKLRGTSHQKGEFPFTVTPDRALVVLPLSAMELKQRSSALRVTTGTPELDKMTGGGFFRDSIVLVSGPTGTGKTLITSHFINGGVTFGERCLLFAFEESRDQLIRNANGWGMDFEKMESEGLLKTICVYPESATLEDHLINIKNEVENYKPSRIAVDSLSALERVSTEKSYREFVIGLTGFVKEKEIAGLFTATTSNLLGSPSVTDPHISTITDTIILLRYVEMFGEMRRGLTVLKMRGSMHDKDIRELTIDGQGMHIGKPFRNVVGILSGTFSHLSPTTEIERVGSLFRDEEPPRDATEPSGS